MAAPNAVQDAFLLTTVCEKWLFESSTIIFPPIIPAASWIILLLLLFFLQTVIYENPSRASVFETLKPAQLAPTTTPNHPFLHPYMEHTVVVTIASKNINAHVC